MNHSTYFLLIFLSVLHACQVDGPSYEVLAKSKVIKKENCNVPVEYPQLKWKSAQATHDEINTLLEKLPEHEYYAKDCSSDNPQLVKGKFEIVLKTDGVLCIEYQTAIESNTEYKTVFHSIVIHPNKEGSGDFSSMIITDPKDVIPNFDRSKILPYIEKYNLHHDANINVLAYQRESNYVITWGISERDLIIYPGGEGEGFGYDKIEIPLSELK